MQKYFLGLIIPSLTIVVAGCNEAQRGQCVWDVPEIESTHSNTTTQDYSPHTIIRIYDVSDLIGRGWMRIEGVSPGGSYDCFPDPRKPPMPPPTPGTRPLDTIDLASLIQIMIDPEDWREAGGEVAVAEPYGTFLIIRQAPRVHREIEALLSSLRVAMDGK